MHKAEGVGHGRSFELLDGLTEMLPCCFGKLAARLLSEDLAGSATIAGNDA
jgi:hypothetical protein